MIIRVNVLQRHGKTYLQMAYTSPITGKRIQKSAGTTNWKQAERAAADWEREINSAHGLASTNWDVFRRRFSDEHLATKRKSTRANYIIALDQFEKLIGRPKDIAAISSSIISQFASKLRDLKIKRKDGTETKLRDGTIRTYLKHFKSALGWAKKIELIAKVPAFSLPETPSSRGRPLTLAEIWRYLQVLKKNAAEYPELVDVIKLCWLGGFRRSEALQLHFKSGPIKINFSMHVPSIIWQSAGQKGKRNEVVPMPPDLARFLHRLNDGRGRVIQTKLTPDFIGRIFKQVGEDAGIKVSDIKYATAQDFRRTFGQRWAMRVHPMTLCLLMRHADIETTKKYYIDIGANDVINDLWEGVQAKVHNTKQFQRNAESKWHKIIGENGS